MGREYKLFHNTRLDYKRYIYSFYILGGIVLMAFKLVHTGECEQAMCLKTTWKTKIIR